MTTSIVLVQYIPKETIKTNVLSSTETINKLGLYPQVGPSFFFRLDTFTDAIMLNVIYTADSKTPVKSALYDRYYFCKGLRTTSPLNSITYGINDNTKGMTSFIYARYWHGYQVFLRPLLSLMNLKGIIIVNYIVFLLLLLSTLLLMWNRISPIVSTCFLCCCIFMNVFILPLSMQYYPCFFISLIGIILVILFPKLTNTDLHAGLTFFTIGALCNFFDLLTTPIITYGLPFIAYYMLYSNEKPIKKLLNTGVSWLLGYSIIWLTKWAICTLFTDYNCFESAFSAAKIRLSTQSGTSDYSITYAFKTILWFFFRKKWALLIIIPIVGFFMINKSLFIKTIKENYWLIIVSLITPLWFIVMRNHSFHHFKLFTWRSLFITEFSLLLFFCFFAKNMIIKNKSLKKGIEKKQLESKDH